MSPEDILNMTLEAKLMKLIYVSDKSPGYTREPASDKFKYYDTKGEEITDEAELKRIYSLVIPPAWQKIWICPKANGHLQVTGYDVLGRKQYKYHPQWSKVRNEHKHNKMASFAKALPAIRKQVEADLATTGFTRNKVLAIAITVMDKTFIRVGNSTYTKLYGSFGLTSLRNRHIQIEGTKMQISFKGKKGVMQEIKLTHARLSKLLKKLKDIPGQELFQYYDSDGTKKGIDSESINEYLKNASGNDFTAKDFRTWWGTVSAATYLAALKPYTSATEAKKHIVETLDFVAKKLGNTRAVCKKYYVHPLLLNYYEEGKLDTYITRLKRINGTAINALIKPEEKIVMDFINREIH